MTESAMTFDKVRAQLLSVFPEIQEWALKTRGPNFDLDDDAPEQYPLVEGVVRPLLFELLETGTQEPLLRRLFTFFERMANSADEDVKDLLGIAILERLVYEKEKVRVAWKYMGPQMKELVLSEAKRQGKLDGLVPR